MSATYTQVTTHTSEPSDPPSTLVHSRNLSNVSSATLHTSTTLHSQPYEPLLRPITPTPASGDFYDVASHQSRASDRILSLPRWSQSNVMSRNQLSESEKKASSSSQVDTTPRRRARRLRWSKRLLEAVLAVWAIYSTARYLLAFTIYESETGQAFAIVMGACTGLSFAFASCAVILSFTQNSLLIHGFSVRALISLRSTLQYLASCCFLGPSIANLVLIFVWRKTSDLELHTRHRCRLDVDLVWSTTSSLCNHKTHKWGAWVTLAALRIVLTLIIIIAFHLIASSQHFMPVRRISKSSYARSKKSHARLDSCQTPLMPYLYRDANVQQQASDSTLSAKSSPRNRLRPTRSQSSVSEEGFQSDVPSYNNSDFLPMNSGQPEPDRELGGFVDRFRHLISQITRETEEGLAFARSDGSSSSRNTRESPPPQSSSSSSEIDVENAHRHPDFHYDDDDDFYTSSSPRAVPSGNYHQPYPEDEHIHMMNGIVRRMPTIQSLGSREMRSSMGASSTHTNRDRAPTRNTVISWSGSDLSIGSEPARSRPNSLTAQAELLAGMFGKMHASEIGELLRRENTVRMVDSGSLSIPDDISEALPEYYSTTSGTSGSKATTDSFHTASSGGTQNSMTRALKDAVKSPMELPAHLQAGRGENEEPER